MANMGDFTEDNPKYSSGSVSPDSENIDFWEFFKRNGFLPPTLAVSSVSDIEALKRVIEMGDMAKKRIKDIEDKVLDSVLFKEELKNNGLNIVSATITEPRDKTLARFNDITVHIKFRLNGRDYTVKEAFSEDESLNKTLDDYRMIALSKMVEVFSKKIAEMIFDELKIEKF